jgi:hypothetical protein
LLIHRLGFRTVKAGVLSRLGEAVLQRHCIVYTYEQLVERIHCQTEELLATMEDPEEAYRLVKMLITYCKSERRWQARSG